MIWLLSTRRKKPSGRPASPWLRSGWAKAGGGGPQSHPVHGLQGTDVPGVGRLLHRFPHIQVILSRDNLKERVSTHLWTFNCCFPLCFRICIDPNDEVKAGLLAQAESGVKLLKPGQWQHMGLTYTQQPEGKKNTLGRVVVWVCGIRYAAQETEENISIQSMTNNLHQPSPC